MNKSKFEKACALFALALMEIREVALTDKNKVAQHLSDLFHNLPASIAQNHEKNPDKVFDDLMEFAQQRGFTKWVENAARQIFKEQD